jgi:hypothetical protein
MPLYLDCSTMTSTAIQICIRRAFESAGSSHIKLDSLSEEDHGRWKAYIRIIGPQRVVVQPIAFELPGANTPSELCRQLLPILKRVLCGRVAAVCGVDPGSDQNQAGIPLLHLIGTN